jgi:hypothetical protein
MHTDHTLNILDDAMVRIGAELRTFNKKTCAVFDMRELKWETAARQRRQQKKAKQQNIFTDATSKAGAPNGSEKSDKSKPKKLNLDTYKNHSLGDYADTIRQIGTSDSFSTESVGIAPTWVENVDL